MWLCLVVWIGTDLRNSRERERQNAERVAVTLTKVLEGHLHITVQKIDLRLSEFAARYQDDVVRRMPRGQVEPALTKYLALFPEALSFRVTDANGKYIYDARGELAPVTIADRPYFRTLRDDPAAGLVVSEPLQSRITGDWVFILGRRLEDGAGRFAGVILTAIRTDFFEQFYSTLDVGGRGSIALWSGELDMVARWPHLPEWHGRKLADSPIPARIAAGEPAGVFSRTAIVDAEPRLFAYRKVEGLPFIYSVGLAEADFLAEWRQRAFIYTVLGTILAAALIVLVRSWRRSYSEVKASAQTLSSAFRSKEQESRALIDAIPAPAWLIDTEGRYIALNTAFCHIAGRPLEELLGKTAFDVFSPENAEKLREGQIQLYSQNQPTREERWFDIGHGLQPFEFLRVPVYDENGRPRGLAGVAWDISERYEAEQRQRLVTQVFDNSTEGLVIIDADRCIVTCNKAIETLSGYRQEELKGRGVAFLASPRHGEDFIFKTREHLSAHGNWRGEIWLRTASGKERPQWCNITVVRDEQDFVKNVILQTIDLTERKAAEARIESLATRDQMTALPNRLGFSNVLGDCLGKGGEGALLMLDLDQLGRINDAFGHEAGDTFLRTAAMRLRRLLREDDTLGRLGGDQFGILMAGRCELDALETLARKLLDAVAMPTHIDDNEVVSTACAGICLFPGDGDSAATLLRNADTAMHSAKAAGHNLFRFFSQDMNRRMTDRLRLESGLRSALERKELVLHYQPQLDLSSNRVIGVECLLRWQHPELGMVGPDRFIPLAEESHLIVPIGHWVLQEACRQNRAWQDAGLPPWVVAVNLSAVQFHDGMIVEQVREALAVSGLAPCWLEMEITESVIMLDPQRIAALLGQLKALGVRLSIDDFGTGYSSLAYLKRFPLDKIKIDRSFVTDVERDNNDAAIVRMVIGIAKELELKVIAEGVETRGQLDFLRLHQCDEIQGYYYSRPIPAAAIPDFLATLAPPAP